MIFPLLHFDDYSQARTDLQRRAKIATAEEVVQDSGVGGASVVHATAIHVQGASPAPTALTLSRAPRVGVNE